jgi:seryl-tRNA synthetase
MYAAAGISFSKYGDYALPTLAGQAYELIQQLSGACTTVLGRYGYDWLQVPQGVSKEACIASGMSPESIANDVETYIGMSTTPYALQKYSFQEIGEDALPIHHAVVVPLIRYGIQIDTHIGFLTYGPCRHDASVEQHERLRQIHESILDTLQIPYRTSVVTARHASPASVKSYVIELLVASDPITLTTISYYHDYQARRSGVTTLDATGKKRFVHSIASDGMSLSLILAALVAVHGGDARTRLEALTNAYDTTKT